MVLCKRNQKSVHVDLCRAGCDEIESQAHLVSCPIIHGDDASLFKGDVGDIDPKVVRSLVNKLTIMEEWKEGSDVVDSEGNE